MEGNRPSRRRVHRVWGHIATRFEAQTVDMPDTSQGDKPSGSVVPGPTEAPEPRRPSVWFRVVATAGGMLLLVDGGLIVGNGVNLGWGMVAGGAIMISGYLVDDFRAQSRERDRSRSRSTPK